MRIDGNSLTILHSSSSQGVALSMNRVADRLANDHWLPRRHRYRRGRRRGGRRRGGGHNQLKDDLSNGRVHSEELADYIAISAPVHSMDGWSLLGRSIHCLSRGDAYTAVHLAYYAELRAALATLASQGIGVFNYPHCIVDGNGDCTIVNPVDCRGNRIGSHQWTWLAFRWWAQEPAAVELLREVIRPNGEALGTWIDATNKARFALEEIGVRWLELWGIDIRRFFGDREARNAASYWPNTLNSWEPRSTIDNYRAIYDMWLPLEPTSEARFAQLDRHLLRILLTRGYFGTSGQRETSLTGRTGFAHEVESLLNNMGMTSVATSIWRDFLTDAAGQEPALLQMANGNSKVGTATHVVEVMSRATMLLRLATGASATLLSGAGIERENLEFWIRTIAAGRQIWQPTEAPSAFVDLWADVQSILDQLHDWIDGQESSTRATPLDRVRELTLLGECERVALWGLGL